MGARKVYVWKSAPGKSDQGVFQVVCSAIEKIRANGRQKLQIQCISTEMVQSQPAQTSKRQFLSQVKFSDLLSQVHLILESGGQVITANSGISEKGGLLERLGLQSNATQRRGTRFEGIRFSMYDFAAYVAQVTELSGSREFLGILVEVEYLPVQSSIVAGPVLKDFVNHLVERIEESQTAPIGQLIEVDPRFNHYKLDDTYSRQHAAVSLMAVSRALAR